VLFQASLPAYLIFLYFLSYKKKLVGGLEHEFYDFPFIGNNIYFQLATDELIFFRGID